MKKLSLLLLLALTACAGVTPPEQSVVTEKVNVAVPVHCNVDPGAEPQYADTAIALKGAANIYERVKLLVIGRAQRMQRLNEISAALAACK